MLAAALCGVNGLAASSVLRSFSVRRWGDTALLRTADVALTAADDAETFEVTVSRPLGLTFSEQPGMGVAVQVVYDGSNAAEQGIQAGDIVIATSASIGTQMWPKNTLAGVESAIQTRVDGQVRLRLHRPQTRAEARPWEVPVLHAFEVELGTPLGIVLRQRTPDEAAGPGGAAGAEVVELQPEGSAAKNGLVRAGDIVVATSASVGEAMWEKSTLEGIQSAISTRLALAPTVRLRLMRLSALGPWASELHDITLGARASLSVEAVRSLRQQRRIVRTSAVQNMSDEAQAAVRALALPAVWKLGGGRGGRRTVLPQANGVALAALLRRLRQCHVQHDTKLANAVMTVRAGVRMKGAAHLYLWPVVGCCWLCARS